MSDLETTESEQDSPEIEREITTVLTKDDIDGTEDGRVMRQVRDVLTTVELNDMYPAEIEVTVRVE